MAEFDDGTVMDDVVDDGTAVVDGADGAADDAAVATAAAGDNPWSWVEERGVTPEQVRDSYENYTQKTQELSREREELQPYQELANALREDVGLQQVVREYFENGQTPENRVAGLESELQTMQTRLALDAEFAELEKVVAEKGLPPFKREDVLNYAVDNNIGSMDAAYKAMTYDDAQESARARLEADIKKGQSAALPKSGHSDGAATVRPSVADIAALSEDEFKESYGAILGGLRSGGR